MPKMLCSFYRVQIEDLLKVVNTKYYPDVVKIMKKIDKLEKFSNDKTLQT